MPQADEWVESVAPLNQRRYFYHVKAQQSRWSTPVPDELPLDPAWHEAISSNGTIYYFHSLTGETSLTRPTVTPDALHSDDDDTSDPSDDLSYDSGTESNGDACSSDSARSVPTPRPAALEVSVSQVKMETAAEIEAKKTRQANFALILQAFAGMHANDFSCKISQNCFIVLSSIFSIYS